MKHIGITGGIGSGKSTVARVFMTFGYPVYFADARAKMLINSNLKVMEAITKEFGKDIYLPEGGLDREKMASIVFSNKSRLNALNSIVHPAVGLDYLSWSREQAEISGKPFVLKEAAILFESGSHRQADGVISVYAPKTIRIGRVVKRDSSNPEQVAARMANQLPETFKLQHSDFIIYNDGEHHVIPQVKAAIEFFSRG